MVHAGATIQYLMDEVSCSSTVLVSAEEEEETHYPAKSQRIIASVYKYLFFDAESVANKNKAYYSMPCSFFIMNRIDLPPEA